MVADTHDDFEAKLTTVAEDWLFTHRSWNTRAAYEADLAWFAAWCAQAGRTPLQATQEDVEQCCADSRVNGDSAALTRRRLAALTSFFDHAVASGEATQNPAEDVERPANASLSRPELDDREARALLDAAEALGSKASVLVSLLLLEGLKLGEALALNLEDVHGDGSTATVTRQGRHQVIALHATTAAAVATYTQARNEGPLLIGNDTIGSRLTRSGVHRILRRVSTRAGITKPVSANTLRRYFVSNAYRDGASVDELRATLGHDDRRTTRRLLPEQL